MNKKTIIVALVVLAFALAGAAKPQEAEKPIVLTAPEVFDVFAADFSEDEITIASKTVWGEARGIESRMEQAAIVWCLLNRVDASGKSLGETASAPHQFAYREENLTVDDFGRDLTELVRDVIERWAEEKNGQDDAGRVLPKQYFYFGGDGKHNHFRDDYNFNGTIWDWSLPNPYI